MKTTPILASMALVASLGACGGDDSTVGIGEQETAAQALCRAAAAYAGCGAESACAQALVQDCDGVASVLADPFLEAATSCIEEGSPPISCLSTSRVALDPTESHRAFAKQFCSACALGVPGCDEAFFGDADSKVAIAGKLILPLGDSVVDELATECAKGIGCAATFMTCAEKVLAERALPKQTLECLLHSLTTQGGDDASQCGSPSGGATSTSGAGGTSGTGTTSGGTTSGAGAGGSGGCKTDADCGSGETCDAGACTGTQVVCFDQDVVIYPLTLTKGDSEFDGNGPDVQLKVNLTRTSDSVTAKACVTMAETQDDWTTGEGCADASLAVPNTGIVGDTAFSAHYLDGDSDPDDVFVDSFNLDPSDVVVSAWCQGDTWGADICGDDQGSCSLCVVHLACVTVKQKH